MFRAVFIVFLLLLRFTSIACEVPDRVNIDALSVDPETNYIIISWTPDLSTNVHGYMIFVGGGAEATDTIFGAGQSSFVLPRPADPNLLIRLAAFDRCLNSAGGDSLVRGGLSDTLIAGRVFQSRIEQRPCQRRIDVLWSDPNDPTRSIRDIAYFKILVSIDGREFDSVATVEASQRFATIDATEHEKEYIIFVRAVSSHLYPTIYANSITDTLTLIVAPEPEFAYVKTVSVIYNDIVEIRCTVDTRVVWDSLFLFADDSLLRAVNRNYFLDNNGILSLPRIPHAFYHFKVSDTCGLIVIYSDSARPILLEAELLETIVILEFSEYVGWSDAVNIRYDLFEIRNGDTTLKETRNQYFHPQPIIFSDSDFAQIMNLSYFVVAYKIIDGVTIDSTRSNVVEVLSRTLQFATAFHPNSIVRENQRFRPIFFIPQPNDRVRFRIFNTFGQVVFSTDDPNKAYEGWDGTFNNKDVQPGTYTFQFELIRGNITTRRRGVTTLIR